MLWFVVRGEQRTWSWRESLALSVLRLHLLSPAARRRKCETRGVVDRSRPKRACDAKLSLSCREGLPNLAFVPFRKHTATFRRLASIEPQQPIAVHCRKFNNKHRSLAHVATAFCAFPLRTSASSVVRARASVGGWGSPCGSVDPRSAGMLNRI